jgi:hypothetical protein
LRRSRLALCSRRLAHSARPAESLDVQSQSVLGQQRFTLRGGNRTNEALIAEAFLPKNYTKIAHGSE